MPIAEFSERQYETIFNRQIRISHDYIWTPSQVQEHVLGFDAAFHSTSPAIFELFFFPTIFPLGIEPALTTWKNIFEFVDRAPLSWKSNLFVQHKRPEFIGSHRGKERHYWNHPYYRYHIDVKQHKRLENLEEIAGDEALVTYACPAFHRYQELSAHIANTTLINSSNFVRPADLKGTIDTRSTLLGRTAGRHLNLSSFKDKPSLRDSETAWTPARLTLFPKL